MHRQSSVFIAKLIDRYGNNIEAALYRVKKDAGYSLSDISREFGFSREFARVIFKKFFREPYTKYFLEKKKTKEMEIFRKNISENQLPKNKLDRYKKTSLPYKGAVAEMIAFDICESLGYRIHAPRQRAFDLIINGYICEIKAAYTPFVVCDKEYITVCLSPKQKEYSDFIIIYNAIEPCFFVIPSKIIKTNKPLIPLINNKYEEYKNAWYLLREGKG
jgi:AraC-like DNA-binding protein